LMELLISFCIITFLLLGTAQLIIHSLFVKKSADSNFKAVELVSSKLEYLKSLPYESEELNEGVQSESLEGEGTFAIFQREWNIQDVSSDMKRIEICSFLENSPHKKIHIVFFLSRKLGF